MKRVTQGTIESGITRVLDAHLEGDRHAVRVLRRPSAYRSTRPLYDVDARIDDGRTLRLVLKRLGRDDDASVGPKPEFLRDSGREADIYRTVLDRGRFGVPTFYGSWSDEEGGAWLLIERVDAVPLSEAPVSDWIRVASWLGEVHARFAGEARALSRNAHLPVIDGADLDRWLKRAIRFRAAEPDATRVRHLVAGVQALQPSLTHRVLALPRTFIHGEFYPANILIRTGRPPRVCPIDWETAAVGPGLLDLAALVTGWDATHSNRLIEAYRRGWSGAGGQAPLSHVELDRGLLHCRLQLSLQWLGWARDWAPPPEQAHDWLSEAEDIMTELTK